MISVSELTKFIKKAYNDLSNGGIGVWHIDLKTDYPLEVGIGWAEGFRSEIEDRNEYITDDGYQICAKVCVFDDMPDYEWSTMPYFENGEVYDTELPVYPDTIEEDAHWLINGAKQIVKYLDSGELTY